MPEGKGEGEVGGGKGAGGGRGGTREKRRKAGTKGWEAERRRGEIQKRAEGSQVQADLNSDLTGKGSAHQTPPEEERCDGSPSAEPGRTGTTPPGCLAGKSSAEVRQGKRRSSAPSSLLRHASTRKGLVRRGRTPRERRTLLKQSGRAAIQSSPSLLTYNSTGLVVGPSAVRISPSSWSRYTKTVPAAS